MVGFCRFALTFRRQLPDFMCEQTTKGTGGDSGTTVMNARVTFEKGHEHYSNVTLNGEPLTAEAARTMELFSTGELGSDLVDLFQAPMDAEFSLPKEETFHKIAARVYEFHIAADKNRYWALRDSRGVTLHPELQGELRLEVATGRLLRLKLRAVHLPRKFELISANVTTDYTEVSIADAGTFLLPSKSVTTACFDAALAGGWLCRKNVLVFHDCRKFGSDSRIITDQPQH